MLRAFKILRLYKFEVILFLSFLVFSWVLMSKTLKMDGAGNILIASKAWSDFAATIPLIRSFSYGSNFPPQYPIFAGPPIRYHFVFFAMVGLLEKIGVPLVSALNILSAFSFFLLLWAIYLLGKVVFKNNGVGILGVIFFLFNGSFSFLEFFKKHPVSIDTISTIVSNTSFASFGPYDGKIVSAFWNLNIFTNQRHLSLAYASFIFLTLYIYKVAKKPKNLNFLKATLIGFLVGIFPFIHLAVFAMMGFALALFFLVYPKLRRQILLTGIIALALAIPQLVYMGGSQVQTSFFHPGYLVEKLTLFNFLKYWFYNLGLIFILLPFGFALAKRSQRKVFLPYLALFVVGNLFQFSPEIAANHKFFNLFVIGANIFNANLLFIVLRRGLLIKIGAAISIFFLILSGVIDLFPIFNDRFISVNDIPNNKAASFILKQTPKDSIFLNASFLYDPASVAGRKIFMGWPYFSWSAGYDTNQRFLKMKRLFRPIKKEGLCQDLIKEGIDYIETEYPSNLEGITIDYSFFENNFNLIYLGQQQQNIKIYSVKSSCS